MNTERPEQGTADLAWYKSSYSGGDGGECVEVAVDESAVHLRDSKTRAIAQLTFRREKWAAFVRFAAES
ncbi:DUF397 domain-containing protein [Streptomyces sp. NBC_00322]|uniref:DUF397 domain-containing protein n=1 Tax=Streptomyces sp. NBC_00322 TaxID=2975712 RepID=UPI002E2B9EC2|nr:DUF397 domain-containing protein [Streptomyces sp. NBC_00322]